MYIKWLVYCVFLLLVFSYYPIYQEEVPKLTIQKKRADFNKALRYILVHEGFYCDISADLGGETYQGISRKFYPNSPIWKVIDNYKKTHQLHWNDSIPNTSWYVKLHYVNLYVDDLFFDIEDQDVLDHTFDCRINSSTFGVMIINQTLREMGEDVPLTGVMTKKTTKALNSVDKWQFLARFNSNRAQFYTRLAVNRPSQLIFLSHWISRLKIQ